MAERQGFEPWVRKRTTVFETAPFDHSGTSPQEISPHRPDKNSITAGETPKIWSHLDRLPSAGLADLSSPNTLLSFRKSPTEGDWPQPIGKSTLLESQTGKIRQFAPLSDEIKNLPKPLT